MMVKYESDAVRKTVYDSMIPSKSRERDFKEFKILSVPIEKIKGINVVDLKRASKTIIQRGCPSMKKTWKKKGILPYPIVIGFAENDYDLVDGHHRLLCQTGKKITVIYGILK